MRTLRRNKALIFAFATAVSVAILAGVGCKGGDTDGGIAGDEQGLGNQFVSDGGAGASLVIEAEDDLSTGSQDGFFVAATDPRGAPLSFVRIYCDTEQGLAIIEPSDNGTAFEHTGADGRMSGVIGCNTPGSFLMECRAPDGYNLIARKTIVCRGDVPEGFAGFPGAAGGNLGGGVLIDETDDITRIIAIEFTDAGGTTSTGPIDPFFDGDCDQDPETTEPEPFTNTLYTVTVHNESLQRRTITSVTVDVEDPAAPVSVVTQNVNVEVAPGGSAEVIGTLINATIVGNVLNMNYATAGGSAVTPNGTFTVTVTVSGVDESGDSFTATAQTTLTFSNAVDNCDI